jgi:hypothetical protein
MQGDQKGRKSTVRDAKFREKSQTPVHATFHPLCSSDERWLWANRTPCTSSRHGTIADITPLASRTATRERSLRPRFESRPWRGVELFPGRIASCRPAANQS